MRNGLHYKWDPRKAPTDYVGRRIVRHVADAVAQLGEYTLAEIVEKFPNRNPGNIQNALEELVAQGFAERVKKPRDTISDSAVSTPYATELETRRYTVLELYRTTGEILSLVGRNFLTREEKNRLQELMNGMENQISQHYPRLRPIFMPRVVVKKYNWGDEERIDPPERWKEPLVQHFLTNFSDLMSKNDNVLLHGDVSSDIVYSGIMNPDIRRKIEQRKMKQKEYERIYRELENATPVIIPSSSTALQVRTPGKLVRAQQSERKLDSLPPPLLAIESGFGRQTVEKHIETGVNGRQIVDEKFLMIEKRTSADLVHRMRKNGVPDDQQTDLIDLYRDTGVSAAFIMRCMKALGIGDVRDIIDAVDEMRTTVVAYADAHMIRRSQVWHIALQMYSGDGLGDTERTIEMLTGRRLSSSGFGEDASEEYEAENQRRAKSIIHGT